MTPKTCFFSILLLLLVITQHVLGQNENRQSFLDSTIVWTEYFYFANSYQAVKYTLDNSPVVFSGKTYHEVLRTFDEFSEPTEPTYFFIRYESGVMYFKEGSHEVELWNFNLMVNDTFLEYTGIPLIVDSVNTITLLTGEQRKRILLRCYEDTLGINYYSEWIEGVGSNDGIFGQNGYCQIDGETYAIMCLFRNDSLIYDNPDFDSCWLTPVATEEIKEDAVKLSPNPASQSITILGLEGQLPSVQIFDVYGRQIFHGLENEIRVNDFLPGCYYVVIRLGKNRVICRGFIKN